MRDKLTKKTAELKAELSQAVDEMGAIKQQIAKLNKRGEQLAQRANFLNGKIEQNEEWLKELNGEA